MANLFSIEQHPSISVFLPLFHTVWSDANLSELEVKVLSKYINQAKWIEKSEKAFLLSKLQAENPPAASEMHAWENEIKLAINNATETQKLSEISILLAKKYLPEELSTSFPNIKTDLDKVEKRLGIISKEAVYLFTAGHDTITTKHNTQSSFDIDQMQVLLDGDQADIIEKVKSIITRPEFAYVDSTNLKAYREKVLKWCKILAKDGLGAMAFPKQFGGGGDMKAYFSIMETLSYHDLSMVIKFGVQFGLWGMSVHSLGTENHHKKYLKKIGNLQLPGCFAMTETNHGSNVKGIETTATYNHDSKTFTIHTPHKLAQKEYIGNAALHGQMATVFAKLIIDGKDYGVNAFVVPLRDKTGKLHPGVSIEDCGRKMGLNGVDNGLISFDQVEIPKSDMLDKYASVNDKGEFESPISSDNRRFFTMLGTLVGGRIGIPRSGLSAAKTGLTIAIRYGNQRRQFGPEGGEEVPILNYRMHQRRLMPLLANAYALHFALQYLTFRFLNRTEEDMQEIEALAAGLKAFATWNTTSTLQECREACGGKGYLSENRIDALKADTDIYTTFEGDNTVLMQLVAKSRLTAFKKEFGEMNMLTIFNYLTDQAKTSIREKNPFTVRKTSDEHLLDVEFHLSAFHYRDREIVSSAAKRLKRHIDNGMDSFDAANVSQHHMFNVGKAYIERVVLEQFILQVEKTTEPKLKATLKKLCDLFALSQIEKNRGWYLEQGYMEGSKTKAIRKMVNQLCWEIRQDAVPLVHAFGIPESCIGAEILKEV
jgi:acyl-CoA oxidase